MVEKAAAPFYGCFFMKIGLPPSGPNATYTKGIDLQHELDYATLAVVYRRPIDWTQYPGLVAVGQ